MKTAKEMFEELGFKQSRTSDEEYNKELILYVHGIHKIEFYKRDKSYNAWMGVRLNSFEIPYVLHKAIDQQLKELEGENEHD